MMEAEVTETGKFGKKKTINIISFNRVNNLDLVEMVQSDFVSSTQWLWHPSFKIPLHSSLFD